VLKLANIAVYDGKNNVSHRGVRVFAGEIVMWAGRMAFDLNFAQGHPFRTRPPQNGNPISGVVRPHPPNTLTTYYYETQLGPKRPSATNGPDLIVDGGGGLPEARKKSVVRTTKKAARKSTASRATKKAVRKDSAAGTRKRTARKTTAARKR
jgi:hypothetical protein